MKNPARTIFSLTLFLLAALSSPVQAQLQFSVTATAGGSSFGYLEGESYTFNFLSFPSYPDTPSSSFDPETGYVQWVENGIADPQMWDSLFGTGLTGSYIYMQDISDFPYAAINAVGNGLGAAAYNDPSDIGLMTLDGTPLLGVAFSAAGGDLPAFATLAAYQDPVAYFASYAGTYSPTSGGISLSTSGTTLNFTTNSVTVTTVPEPSAWALMLASLITLGIAAARKRVVGGRER